MAATGLEFESSYSQLNFRYRTCFEQGATLHSGNYKVWIHSETFALHDKNIQLKDLLQFFEKDFHFLEDLFQS